MAAGRKRPASKDGDSGPAAARESQEPATFPIAPPAHQGGPVLALEVDGQRYGLPIGNVIQIVEMVAITRLPSAPRFIAGAVDFHGQVIPIVDMRRRFALPEQPYTQRTPIIISQLDGHTVGLVVDGVTGVLDLQPEQVEGTAQIVTTAWTPQTHYLSGIARLIDGLLLLLDPSTILSPQEVQALSRATPRRRPQQE